MKRLVKIFVISMVFFFTIVLSSWIVWHTLSGGKRIPKSISNTFIQLASLPSITNRFVANHFRIPDLRYISDTANTNFFQYFVNSASLPEGKILTSSLDDNKDQEIKLINIKNGIILKKWVIPTKKILELDQRKILDKSILRLLHPILLKDSSIIFNASNLYCFDKKNQLKWMNQEIFHHSIELLNDTTIWACSFIESNHPQYINGIDSLMNNAIIEIDAKTGKTIFKKSVAEILKENGYEWLFAVGNFEKDALHLNEVYPATNNTKYWNNGDLLISLRHRSTVLLYRPSTNKIIWLKTGPWSNQHSCSFIDSSKIMIFGNDVLRDGLNTTLLNGNNQIYIYDFSSNKVSTPYFKIMQKMKIKTFSEGRATYLNNGQVFIDESNFGNVFIIDTLKPILKYTERVDKYHIKMFNWNRYIPN